MFKQFLTKLKKDFDHFSGLERPWGGWVWIEYIALKGCWCENGGYPSASSIAVMPKAQISVLSL